MVQILSRVRILEGRKRRFRCSHGAQTRGRFVGALRAVTMLDPRQSDEEMS
jgi:hypothetical protein